MKKVINVHGLSLGLLNDKLWGKNRSSIPRNCTEDFSYFLFKKMDGNLFLKENIFDTKKT